MTHLKCISITSIKNIRGCYYMVNASIRLECSTLNFLLRIEKE